MTRWHRSPHMSVSTAGAMVCLALLVAGCGSNGAPTDAVIVTTAPQSPASTLLVSEPEAATPTKVTTDTTAGVPGTTLATHDTAAPTTDAPTTDGATIEPIDLATVEIERTEVGTFDAPIGLATRPNDDSLYVIQQDGQVMRVEPSGDQSTVLDIGDDTQGEGERGLLGLAFHPTQPVAYTYFTDLGGATTIAEFALEGDGTFDRSTERRVWRLEQPYSNHNGGDLNFGPDAMLYAGVGDGGSGGDPERRADDPATAFGSIIRIDPVGSDDGEFTIPDDNPFGNEVWAYGLRNPWKFNFDPATGALWIADVGQNQFEEINRVHPGNAGETAGRGANFGWSAFEATTRFNDDVAESDDMISPVLYYDHTAGRCSISGGAMLEQWYIYGDFCTGELWGFDGTENISLGDGFGNVAAVRNGPDGGVYVIDRNGPVYRLSVG